MRSLYLLLYILIIGANTNAQTGNTGIGTTTPGSKLTVNGSFAAAYTPVTATTYTAGENDFYVVWNGTAAGTITLPASTSGPDRTGRLYFFKNTSAVYTLTVDAAGTELIDNNQTLVLQPGEAGMLVKTSVNTASGITYELVQVSKTQVRYEYAVVGNTAQTRSNGAVVDADFNAVEYSTNGGADFNLATNTWTCPQSGVYSIEFTETGYISTSNAMTHVSLRILRNAGFVALSYYNLGNSAVTSNLYNSGSVSVILNLTLGNLITGQVQSCSGCSVPTNVSTNRRMVITRL